MLTGIPDNKLSSTTSILPDIRDTQASRWILYLILIACAYISVSYAFQIMIAKPNLTGRLIIHQSVIDGTAPKPIQFRILTYYIVEGIHRLTNVSIWRLDLILRFIFTCLSLVFMFKYMRRWFDFSISALGPMIILALLPVTYMNYSHQPHDMPNLFFTILALHLIRDRREQWLILLIPIAMLNRESFIMVLWVWFFYNLGQEPMKSLTPKFILFSLIALAIYFALPYYYGARTNHVDLIQIKANLSPDMLRQWIPRILAFAGPLILASIVRFRSKPLFLRRASGYVIIFLAVNFIFGIYRETRLFLPILPIIIPLGLAAIFPAFDPDNPDRNLIIKEG